jgi:site-specific DNA-methyltransferase (adenine-specific)
MGTIELFHGDCLEVMKTLPDRSVDLFLTDLPYGCLSLGSGKKTVERYKKAGFQGINNMMKGCPWDVKIDLVKFWEQIKRLRKNDSVPTLMFCTERFGNELFNSNPSEFRYALIWSKGRGTSFLTVNKMPMRSHECIYIFAPKCPFYKLIKEHKPGAPGRFRKANTQYCPQFDLKVGQFDLVTPAEQRCPISVLDFKNSSDGLHPTAKRVDLYKWLVSRYCPDGGTVLDPTAGSFNSCLAAAQLGMTAIGIEKDDTFYKQAEVRFGLRSPDEETIAAPVNEH